MMLALHILIAFTSLILTGYAYARPSGAKLKASYAMIAATLASGTILVAATRSHLLESCVMGLLFLAVSLYGIAAAQRKLATETNN